MVKFRAVAALFICVAFGAIFVFRSCGDELLFSARRYINKADGYTIKIPKGFSVDESFLPDTLRLVSRDCIIEVYAQACKDKNEELSYINYTNSAITSDKVNYTEVKQFCHGNRTVLRWSRKKLSKIENDKNHYLKIDIPKGKPVYTLLVKSTKKDINHIKYLNLLTFITPTGESSEKNPVKFSARNNFNQETQAFYDTYFKNSQNVEWGIYQPDYIDMPGLSYIEDAVRHKFGVLLQYTEFNEAYSPSLVRGFLDKAYSEGRVVELTLQPKRDHMEGNDLFRVLDGYYDEFLHDYAQDIADFSHPVMFRFCNEMNGDWCEYSGYRMSLDTQLYREMYRYVYDIFRQHNADNVIWVWNPNGKSFPDFKWNSENMYYPGNGVVNVLGLTLYNTGNFYPGESWKEFEELYAPLYKNAMKKYNMPFMITEFACARKGGNKEQWTKNMLEKIGEYDNIKIAIWWNGADFDANAQISRAYYINDSQEMMDIFKNYFE